MGRLRIIAGELKGRRIDVVAAPGLRPTADRVREALFSILADRVSGAAVLDAYAGTGALGFEALSRGARHVVFVEAAPAVLRGLERTRADFGCQDRTRVVAGDPASLLERDQLTGPFDLVLADPPYADGGRGRFLDALARAGALAPAGLLVLEGEARESPAEGANPARLRHLRRARYGRAALDFFEPGGPG